jgi:DNA invertase Pin-like site-specific DNA recombinase
MTTSNFAQIRDSACLDKLSRRDSSHIAQHGEPGFTAAGRCSARGGVQRRDVFFDVTSGSKTAVSRPGMKRLLEYAESGGGTVVVWRVDRLGRSLIDVLNTVNLLRDRGVAVKSISDGIDTATSTGRPMLNMLTNLAEDGRELITERVNAGIAAAKQSGTRFGRPPSDPAVIAEKLRAVQGARARGRTVTHASK